MMIAPTTMSASKDLGLIGLYWLLNLSCYEKATYPDSNQGVPPSQVTLTQKFSREVHVNPESLTQKMQG